MSDLRNLAKLYQKLYNGGSLALENIQTDPNGTIGFTDEAVGAKNRVYVGYLRPRNPNPDPSTGQYNGLFNVAIEQPGMFGDGLVQFNPADYHSHIFVFRRANAYGGVYYFSGYSFLVDFAQFASPIGLPTE
jgi:hypothetical protein